MPFVRVCVPTWMPLIYRLIPAAVTVVVTMVQVSGLIVAGNVAVPVPTVAGIEDRDPHAAAARLIAHLEAVAVVGGGAAAAYRAITML